MQDQHPLLKDRLKALGVFSGIAIAAVAGFELVISGGFDFITPGAQIREVAPSSYVQEAGNFWTPSARPVALSSTEPLFAGDDAMMAADEDLAGGPSDDAAPDEGFPQARSFEDIEADIAALYEETAPSPEPQSEYGGLAPAYPDDYADEPVPDDDPKKPAPENLSAYESGLSS